MYKTRGYQQIFPTQKQQYHRACCSSEGKSFSRLLNRNGVGARLDNHLYPCSVYLLPYLAEMVPITTAYYRMGKRKRSRNVALASAIDCW